MGTTPFHVGLTAATVTDAAVALTRESHLYAWSVRDLARALEVAPSVIYHHVGGKDSLARAVAERVLARLPLPSASLRWEAWFRELLAAIYDETVSYPGVAKWVVLHGPVFPSVLPIIDRGIRLLEEAGFGPDAVTAYATLLNNAVLTISVSDDRLLHEDDGPRDHAAMMADFERVAVDDPDLGARALALVRPFSSGGEEAARNRRRYFDFTVETTVRGLRARLAEQADSPRDPR